MPGAKVELDDKSLGVGADGSYVFGIGYDRTSPAKLKIATPGCSSITRSFQINRRQYGDERIDQLPGKFVTPEDRKALARIERENQMIRDARAHNTDQHWFMESFDWPVEGELTDHYGVKRILNGQERRPHFGLDIAVKEGTTIRAPQNAVVRLAEHDLYYSGGTVILDHGLGVSTSYLHMRRVDVKVGQHIERGESIGKVGMTGRATGPHLCWRLNWFQERLDPQSVMQGSTSPQTLPVSDGVGQSCSRSDLIF